MVLAPLATGRSAQGLFLNPHFPDEVVILSALAYNLGNFTRTLAMPKSAEPWSLTSLEEKQIKTPRSSAMAVYVTFRIGEVAVSAGGRRG